MNRKKWEEVNYFMNNQNEKKKTFKTNRQKHQKELLVLILRITLS